MTEKCKIKIKASFEKGLKSSAKGNADCILNSLARVYAKACIDCGVDKKVALKGIKDHFESELKERNK